MSIIGLPGAAGYHPLEELSAAETVTKNG